jgi:hypothetical protein
MRLSESTLPFVGLNALIVSDTANLGREIGFTALSTRRVSNVWDTILHYITWDTLKPRILKITACIDCPMYYTLIFSTGHAQDSLSMTPLAHPSLSTFIFQSIQSNEDANPKKKT